MTATKLSFACVDCTRPHGGLRQECRGGKVKSQYACVNGTSR